MTTITMPAPGQCRFPAYADQTIHLDALTPAARAVARYVARPIGTAPIALPLIATQTRRERLATMGRAVTADDERWGDLDEPDRISWSGSSLPVGGVSGMTMTEWCEVTAARLPIGYRVDDGRTYDPLLTASQVLDLLARSGRPITASTWRAYVARGQAPAPVQHVGRTPRWSTAAVIGWCTPAGAGPV